MRGALWKQGLRILVALAVVGHLLYWYLPVRRLGVPDLEKLGPRVGDEVWLWIPFPHLNLRSLETTLEDSEALLAAAGRLAGLPAARGLPGFGPFRLPPSKEMVIAMGQGGDAVRIEARVDPVVSLIARLAGRVAANPWLRGGEIETSQGTVTVAWSGTRWVARRGSPAGAIENHASRNAAPSLAVVFARSPGAPLPSGFFVLRKEGGDWLLALDGGETLAGSAPPPEVGSAVFAQVERHADGRIEGLLFFAGSEADALRVGSTEIAPPGAAIFYEAGGSAPDLPGGGILRLTRGRPVEGEYGRWWLRAYSESDAALTAAWIESHSADLAALAQGETDYLAVVRPRRAFEEVRGLIGLLARLPLTPREERRRWRDVETVLDGLLVCDRLDVSSGRRTPGFRLRCTQEGLD